MKAHNPVTRILAVLAIMAMSTQSKENCCVAATANNADTAVTSSAKYKINLSPAWKAGPKFAYVADDSSKSQTITLGSDGLNVEINILCHLEGQGEVLALGKNGAVSKVSLTISAMNATVNDKPVVNLPATGANPQPPFILAPGTVVIVERNDTGVETFTVNGKPIIGRAVMGKHPQSPVMGGDGRPTYLGSDRYLRMLMDLDNSPGTDEDVFGPKAAVAVGDSWPSSADARAKLLEAFGGDGDAYRHMAPANAAGIDSRQIVFPATPATMKLESVSGSGYDQKVAVSGILSLKGLAVPIPPNPAGPAPTPPMSMDIQNKFNLSCPAATAKGVLTRSSTLTIKQYPTTPAPPSPTNTGYKSNCELAYTQQYTF